MRKIIMLNRVSLDGFYAGANGEMDWFIHDPEVDKAWHETDQSDTVLMGRVTYQQFANFWPSVAQDPNAPEAAKKLADELNQMTKIVFSKTMNAATWQNSRLVHGDIAQEVRTLKQGNGAAILIFGSGTIVQQLAAEGLIDEYWLTVTPVVLGSGKALFTDAARFSLELVEARPFSSGNVLLRYRTC